MRDDEADPGKRLSQPIHATPAVIAAILVAALLAILLIAIGNSYEFGSDLKSSV
jgi:hypothetical protein